MATYIIATVSVTDPARFGEYLKGIVGLSDRFGGETSVRGAVTEVLEGDAPAGERVIVTKYKDTATAKSYMNSPEYQAAKVHRIGAANVTIRLIEMPD
jgi:uncharacterized protein (DUF1330 family)